jgi:hypothetical protein
VGGVEDLLGLDLGLGDADLASPRPCAQLVPMLRGGQGLLEEVLVAASSRSAPSLMI